jgi:hypothetical protein
MEVETKFLRLFRPVPWASAQEMLREAGVQPGAVPMKTLIPLTLEDDPGWGFIEIPLTPP